MKSFASLLLAATVSANYCYTDGCNCTEASRACYPLPRQNMRPAVNTCCPVGVQPTVYGRDNGRSVNITPTMTSALLFGGKCQDVDASATVTGEDGTCFTVKNTGTTLTLAPASPDMTFKVYLQGSQNNVVLGNGVTGVNFDKLEVQGNMNHAALSPESTINQVSMKGSSVKITGNPTYCKTGKIAGTPRTFNATQSPAVCAQYSGKSNLMFGATEDTWSPTTNLQADCAATFQARVCAQDFQARGCNQLGLGNARKECEKRAGDVRKECEKNAGDVRKECEKAQVSNLQVYGGGNPNTHLAKLDNFVDCRDYQLYCCQEWNRFEWECITQDLPSASQNCSAVVSAAKQAGITADRPGTCAAQTASLPTCVSGCGKTTDINIDLTKRTINTNTYQGL